MLLFKKKFLDAIRSGEKAQTFRLWRYAKLKAGQRSYIPGVGYIRIAAVDQVELASISDADAVLDGFPSADALRREIETIYRDRGERGERTYRIRFAVLPPAEQAEARAARQAKKLSGAAPQRPE